MKKACFLKISEARLRPFAPLPTLSLSLEVSIAIIFRPLKGAEKTLSRRCIFLIINACFLCLAPLSRI